MTQKKIIILSSLIALASLIADQATKFWVVKTLMGSSTVINVLPMFNIVLVFNYGISFGMFQNMQYGDMIFSGIAILITLSLIIWLIRAENFRIGSALGLIIGGAIGNIIDRINIGAVVDFLDFYIGNYHWPAFNIADSTIFIGVVILLIDTIFYSSKEHKKTNEGTTDEISSH